MEIKGYNSKKIEKDFLKLYGEVPPYFKKFFEDYKNGLFYISPYTIRYRYKKYSSFLKSCGYVLTEKIPKNKSDIDFFITNWVKKNKKFPRQKDFDDNNISFGTRKGYKNYKEVLKKFGYEKTYNSEIKYSNDEIQRIFISHFKNFNYVNESIISREYNKGNIPFGYGVIKKRFKNYNWLFKKSGYYNMIKHNKSKYFTKEEMIKIFKKTFEDLKKPPSQLDVTRKYKSNEFLFSVSNISSKFGSYSKFLIESGYQYNKGTYSQKYLAKDGMICDSKSELKIDTFLHKNNIEHTHQPKYKDLVEGLHVLTKGDFMLKDGTIVEFFGLKGNAKYDKKIRKKVNILKKNNIRYIDLYPKDLDKLENVFQSYIFRGCQ